MAVVSNPYGTTNSVEVTLTVNPLSSSCYPPPSGIIGWWPGEDNANDIISTNNGILTNGVTFNAGVVGQAFHFNGSNQDVQIPYTTALEPSNVTVECWVKLDALASPVAAYPGLQYIVFKQNSRGGNFEAYELEKNRISGHDVFRFLVTSKLGKQVPAAATTVPQPGVWYHLAGTYDGTTVKIYVNGVLEGTAKAGFPIDYGTEPLYFGTTGTSWDGRLEGTLDEVSIYNRALGSNEIAGIYNAGSEGKCVPQPPYIITQPTNQFVIIGGTASFVVVAGGAAPLSYQWISIGTNNTIVGTNATLILTNVQPGMAGHYQAKVSNAYGTTNSAEVTLFLKVRIKPHIQSMATHANGLITLNLMGDSSTPYVLYCTTNLAPPVVWKPIYTNYNGGPMQFIDTNRYDSTAKYYRWAPASP
jgi:hypothetical protein